MPQAAEEGKGTSDRSALLRLSSRKKLAKWLWERRQRWRLAYRLRDCEQRVLPSFIIIGAQKSGTTSLFKYLCAHPQVLPPLRKEVNFLVHRRPLLEYRAYFPLERTTHRRAQKLGQPVITGEASIAYMTCHRVARRICAELPDVKLLVVLRNPVDRALSHYHHARALGWELLATFEAALDAEAARLDDIGLGWNEDHWRSNSPYMRFGYTARGLYYDQLRPWFDVFPRSQIKVISTHDLWTDAQRVYSDVLAYLGLADRSLPKRTIHNRRTYPPMAPDTRQRLVGFFRRPNEKLFHELLGYSFDWDH